jgi:hypothetical protein
MMMPALVAIMLLLLTGQAGAAQIKCYSSPPRVNTYVNWRIIDGRRCYYIGKRIDKSLLYWEREQSPTPTPLPVPRPAIRAQSDFEDRWSGLGDHENLFEPTMLEQWRLWQ